MTSQPPKHILMLPIHMWGRARPLAVLASRMVRMRPILITLCIADKLWDRTKAEIESDFTPEEGEYLSRIRLLRIEQGADWMDSAGIRDHFLKIWSSLCAGESVAYEAVDGSTGLINLLSEPLNAIVIDNLIVEVMEALHKQRLASPRSLSLRLYAWSPVSSDFMVAQGRTDPMPFVRALQEQQNISLADAAVAVFNTKHGRLIQSPCLPDMYDYEFSPQSYPFPKEIVARIFTKVVEQVYPSIITI
ncbi:hypothetical protein BN946_scf184787.g22 [Trametes cinnabarina]|uniref:Uncharacterized protein n=1 Tax=Pycnoporus cinnabarinus TaxID=5643 RepID=A0A060SXX0_PYCCI|nr:hypothetical protein BN946_scf184787.g22 [Trametes cinnabarina]